MSSSSIAMRVRGLGKMYKIARVQTRQTTLAEALIARLKRPLARTERDEFWALQDLDFDIPAGEVVGVIGRNGAGKSTLLKVLSRITEPTRGSIDLWGRVGSLLEVGTGFHPELTGRENIYLNGTILGMTRREIDRQFDAIVDFSGVERFLETPVKRYSSGMYVRLAFAVAAHLQSEILLVDEVLAVGDAEFQRKCLGKMRDVASSGRTVLFVSHHMQSVQLLCTKGMYMEQGRLTYAGEPSGAIRRYVDSFARDLNEVSDPTRRGGTGELRFTSVRPGKDVFECGEEKTVRFTIERFKPSAGKVFVSCQLINDQGVTVVQCDSRLVNQWIDVGDRAEGEITIKTPWLKPGTYSLSFFLCSSGVIDRFEPACQIHVIPLLPYKAPGNDEATGPGVVFADFDYALRDEPVASEPEQSPSMRVNV